MSAQKDDVGPGLAPALFLGFLTLLLGAVLGTASMISQPVATLTKQANPETLAPGTVYHIKGDRLGRSAWEAKEDAWKAGTIGMLTLTEQDLNQWSRERLMVPADAETESESSYLDFLNVTAEPVNFRILEDRVQLATEITLEGVFPNRKFLYQVFGRFESTPAGVRFVPDSGTIGSAPLGSVPAIKEALFSLVSRQFRGTEAGEWLGASLESIDAIELADGRMVLRRRLDG